MSNAHIGQANAAQVRAARPKVSSWVTANAGSGKTRVLASRVARLLLLGIAPQKILCLTFTNAAAAEMQNRLFAQLGDWAMLPDDALRDALAYLGESPQDPAQLLQARTLFARALETPGGLKIQTIHAFCESILHRFPLEAGVSPDFSVLDDRRAKALRAQVLDEIAQDHPQVFDALVAVRGSNPGGYIYEILKQQHLFTAPFDRAATAQALGISADLTERGILQAVVEGLGDDTLDELATHLATGGSKDIKAAQCLAQRGTCSDAQALDMLQDAFLISNGTAKAARGFPTKDVFQAYPPAIDLVATLKTRVEQARNRRIALAALPASKALHDFALEFLTRYNVHKQALGALEFEDLIRKTDRLLRDREMAPWVLYRLDNGIDHILVDEAQDTSPIQWDIIGALAQEIYANAGDGRLRTLFVVGDEKQSIFSFQGADPAEFDRMCAAFTENLAAIDQPLKRGELLYSFRSAAPVLQLVDKVFDGKMEHRPIDDDRPGRIELWPFPDPQQAPPPPPWYAPVDQLPQKDPALVLAMQVARKVADLLQGGQVLPGTGRPIMARDFLILVQSRGPLFHAVIKNLKSLNVPVAGADQLVVADELPVKDLLSCLRFAASPGDDLSLAEVLRSPLMDVDEASLFALAHNRSGSLWQAVQGAMDAPMLHDLLAHADFERPFELLERILTRHDGRRKLVARLGPEAEDGIDELLALALGYERDEIPSLTGFLERVFSEEIKVKRQMDDASNQVRVMSIHGAKGLEAPIVILPQSVKQRNNDSHRILPLGDVAVCDVPETQSEGAMKKAVEDQKALRRAEEDRLLYVALTRAESWLIIAGHGKRDGKSVNWYDPIENAMQALGADQTPDGLVWQHNWPEPLETAPRTQAAPPRTDDPVRYAPVGALTKPPALLRPSDLGGGHGGGDAGADPVGALFGTHLHLLLETLPDLPAADREGAAWQILRNAGDCSDPEAVVSQAMRVLQTHALAPLFADDALREVPVFFEIPGLGPFSGRIDVLLVGDDITVVDFKSNANPPPTAAQTPEAYLRQMGAYRAAVAQIWPDKPVKTAICWTHNADLMEIPQNLTDRALENAPTP